MKLKIELKQRKQHKTAVIKSMHGSAVEKVGKQSQHRSQFLARQGHHVFRIGIRLSVTVHHITVQILLDLGKVCQGSRLIIFRHPFAFEFGQTKQIGSLGLGKLHHTAPETLIFAVRHVLNEFFQLGSHLLISGFLGSVIGFVVF